MLTNRTSPQTNVTNITKVTTQLTVTLPDSIRPNSGDESDEPNRPGRKGRHDALPSRGRSDAEHHLGLQR